MARKPKPNSQQTERAPVEQSAGAFLFPSKPHNPMKTKEIRVTARVTMTLTTFVTIPDVAGNESAPVVAELHQRLQKATPSYLGFEPADITVDKLEERTATSFKTL